MKIQSSFHEARMKIDNQRKEEKRSRNNHYFPIKIRQRPKMSVKVSIGT